jgi:hypothetical protein
MRPLVRVAIASLVLGLGPLGLGVVGPRPAAAAELPPIKHVFVIVLENKNYDETFGPNSPAAYFNTTLLPQGQFLRQYYATAHLSLGNYIAMVSGQAPNPQTQSDCQIYTEFAGAPVLDPNGQAVGQGCVYPAVVPTLPDQLEAKALTWKGYMQDMGNHATEPQTCRHPTINTQDTTQQAEVGDQYAARHNPFVYFHSIIDEPSCAANDVPLDRLPADLASAATTANFSFITPNLCEDGHDGPCVDGRPGGLASIDDFLEEWVPKILASPAYQQDGMLIVTFDEAEAEANPDSDASACCGEIPGPNSPLPGIFGLGGGRVGALVLSPWTQPGSVNDTPYNHYSLLRSVEDLFTLDHLGFAAASGLVAFHEDVYNGTGPAAAGAGAGGSGSATGNGSGADDTRSVRLPATGSGWGDAAVVGLGLLALSIGTRRMARGLLGK